MIIAQRQQQPLTIITNTVTINTWIQKTWQISASRGNVLFILFWWNNTLACLLAKKWYAESVCLDDCWMVLFFVCFVFADAAVSVGVTWRLVPLRAARCQHFLRVLLHAQWFFIIKIWSILLGQNKQRRSSPPQIHLQDIHHANPSLSA